MKVTYLYINTNGVVKGVAQVEGDLAGLTPEILQGDPNLFYINTRTYIDGVLAEYTAPKKTLTTEEFINSLTDWEYTELLQSADINAIKLNKILDKFSEINLEDEKVISAVTNLEIFTKERKTAILNG